MVRTRLSLNGQWAFSLPQGQPEQRTVPGSYPCVGNSVYARGFEMEPLQDNKRCLLTFEGIAYEGIVSLNGHILGRMLPYSRYTFDITGLLLSGRNELTLNLSDITAVFGPSEGWKSYGGIIREVTLETVSPVWLEDVFFHAEVSDDLLSAQCSVDSKINGIIDGVIIRAELSAGGKPVCTGTHAFTTEECRVSLTADLPRLWSPENPFLYTLTVILEKDGNVLDTWEREVGIKRFEARGSRFYLNGEPLFLAGVCRHDLQNDADGFTQTDAQIENDLRMIKDMGANFVRLVHYPHDCRVLSAADRIGLLVSGEPGLWWSDLENPEITDRALEVLEKMIIRDRSHVSVAFWLAFNECVFTKEFLRDAAATARKTDSTRLISGANCMDLIRTREWFDEEKIDFYTFHPYGSYPDRVTSGFGSGKPECSLEDAAGALSGKPLVFTEWGGYYVNDNPALFRRFCDEMFRLSRNEPPKPTLAGMFYWAWQDIYEANRGAPACEDGILNEGLVTVDRRLKMNYTTFAHALSARNIQEALPHSIHVTGAGVPGANYLPVALTGTNTPLQKSAFEQAVAHTQDMSYFFKKKRRLTRGPVLPESVSRLGCLPVDLRAGRPLIVNPQTGTVEMLLPGKAARAIWFIGQCTLGHGWPVSGRFEEAIGEYVVSYEDGAREVIPLRNGLETATVLGLQGPSAIDPRASLTGRALRFSYDKNWEEYQLGLFRAEVNPGKSLSRLTVTAGGGYSLLLYGLTLEF
ncbi:MAG: hypothetical protein LBR76_04590 [Oscillospiraceae bacterium]|jgi:beta-glucuronidase|nr:hypothetical protein [Oscillospiraceae bacterium]